MTTKTSDEQRVSEQKPSALDVVGTLSTNGHGPIVAEPRVDECEKCPSSKRQRQGKCFNGVLTWWDAYGPKTSKPCDCPCHKTDTSDEQRVSKERLKFATPSHEKCYDLGFRDASAELEHDFRDARTKNERLEAEVEQLRAGIRAVSELINQSAGVDGLHLNGDIAPWEELLEGGQYEEWLCDFSIAIHALDGESGE